MTCVTCETGREACLSDRPEAKALVEPVVSRSHTSRRDHDVVDAFVGRKGKFEEIHYGLVVGDVDMPVRGPRRLGRLVRVRDGGPAILALAGQCLARGVINVADADVGGVGAAQFRETRPNAIGTT